MGLRHAGTGEVAGRLCQSCEASLGEVDGVGLLLGQDPSTHAFTETYYVAGCFQFSRTYRQPSEIRFSNRLS